MKLATASRLQKGKSGGEEGFWKKDQKEKVKVKSS